MALDGAMLGIIGNEIKSRALGAKIDKIHQPSREELVFVLRGKEGQMRLLVSARANSPRVHFTESVIENPAQPPMLCMLLRKKLGGARLSDVRQYGSDRILMIDFDTVDELGDRQILTLYIEIMGRYSNAILASQDGTVIDAVKRVDLSMSSVRPIIPGMKYVFPPAQEKSDIISNDIDEAFEKIISDNRRRLDKAILSEIMGISPIVAREVSFGATGSSEFEVGDMTPSHEKKLYESLRKLRKNMLGESVCPVMVSDESGKPIDITFFYPNQYGEGINISSYDSFSQLLDTLYSVRDLRERMRVKEKAVLQTLTVLSERISKKLSIQKAELKKAENREDLRNMGDLITANIYRLKKGDTVSDLIDYTTGETVTVTLDPRLTPAQNAQKYYKEYTKAKTAEQYLTQLIADGEAELVYINSTLDSLERASSVRELAEIREELEDGGYIKRQNAKMKRPAALPALRYMSNDGFTILVGRNNKQNDRLTLKESSKKDLWLHVTKRPGSHVIIQSQGKEIPPATIEQAAILAVYHSSARESGLTAVDFTFVKNVSKPQGSKPGMVIYTNQTTVFVRPDAQLAERLAVKES